MRTLDPASPLARALERGRDRFNSRVTMARKQGARFDAGTLAQHLASAVAPAVEAVAALEPGRTDAVTEALFDLSLELLAKEVAGPASRHPWVGAAWRELLPRLGAQLALQPQRVAAAVTNAAWNLGQEPSARPAEWLAAVAALSPRCTPDLLLVCGQVLAWRAGMAHYRESALAAWEQLPDALARASLGVEDEALGRERLRQDLADPWRAPGTEPSAPMLHVVATLGGFRGFGGPFLTPPRVFVARQRLWAADVEHTWSVHADCFGQTLQRAASPPPAEKPGVRVRLSDDGTVDFGGLSARLSPLERASGFAATAALLALTLTRSHRLVLVARTGGGA